MKTSALLLALAGAANASQLRAAEDTTALLQQQMESLRSMNGMIATPGVLATLGKMEDLINTEIKAKVVEAKATDVQLMTMKQQDVNSCDSSYTSRQKEEDAKLETRNQLKNAAGSCYAQVNSDTQDYLGHSQQVEASFALEVSVCCKRDHDFENSKTFAVGEGMATCDFTSASADGCVSEFMDQINAAEFEIKQRGLDWEAQNKNCIQQQGVSEAAAAKHDENYVNLKNLVNTCTEDVKIYNGVDNTFFLTVTANCEEYQSCYYATKANYDSAKEAVSKRIADRKVEIKMVEELLCMLKSFREAGKIDMANAADCADKPYDGSMDQAIPSIPALQTCTTHTEEPQALPSLTDSITHLKSDCPSGMVAEPFVPAEFVKNPACPEWCQPITGSPTTVPPTTKAPTSPPTLSPAQKLAEQIRKAAAEAKAKGRSRREGCCGSCEEASREGRRCRRCCRCKGEADGQPSLEGHHQGIQVFLKNYLYEWKLFKK